MANPANDVFYNDIGEYVVIYPRRDPIRSFMFVFDNVQIPARQMLCYHGNSAIYICPSGRPYYDTITVYINDEPTTYSVKQYPSYPDKLLMTTLVFKEEPVVKQWIKYHSRLGVDNFIIYDNVQDPTDMALESHLAEEIATGQVLVIKWCNPLFVRGARSGQTTQQNHSIYAFRKARYIGLLDVDEYLNPRKERNLRTILDTSIGDEYNKREAVNIYSKIFRNPSNKSTDGYNFLKIDTCTKIIKGDREKLFIIPKHDVVVSVHVVTVNKYNYKTISEDVLFFNHYFFLNKSERGRENADERDCTILENAEGLIA